MKKYIYSLLTAAVLLFAAGCSKDDDGPKTVDSGVVGQWHQTDWNGQMPSEFDVYVEFAVDGRCTIYQQVETSFFEKRTGTYAIEGARLTGVYSSGAPWRSAYDFTLSADGNTLTMTSNASAAVESVYVRTTIPEEIRNAPEVRSAHAADFPWIF